MLGYVGQIWRCRYFWLSLVKMDLRTRYRRSVLGLGWSLLHPIAMTVIFCLIFLNLLMPGGDVAGYAPYLLAGLATWNYIMSSTLQGCQCFFLGESYIRQYPAPMAIYPLRTALGGIIHFFMALSVVFILVLVVQSGGLSGPAPSAQPDVAANPRAALVGQPTKAGTEEPAVYDPVTLLVLIPNILLLFAFAWSLAVLAGVANVHFQDTQHLCEVGFQILLYLSPILYKRDILKGTATKPDLTWLADYNPIAAFLDLIRKPVLEGQIPNAQVYFLALGTLLVVAGGAILTLARSQRRLIFHL